MKGLGLAVEQLQANKTQAVQLLGVAALVIGLGQELAVLASVAGGSKACAHQRWRL